VAALLGDRHKRARSAAASTRCFQGRRLPASTRKAGELGTWNTGLAGGGPAQSCRGCQSRLARPGRPRWRRCRASWSKAVLARFGWLRKPEPGVVARSGLQQRNPGGFGDRIRGPSSGPTRPPAPVSAPPNQLWKADAFALVDQPFAASAHLFGGFARRAAARTTRRMIAGHIHSLKSRKSANLGLLTLFTRFPGQQGPDRGGPPGAGTSSSAAAANQIQEAAGEAGTNNRG